MEYASLIDWSPLWSAGAPSPQVFSNGFKTYLAYLTDEENDSVAIVEFFKSHSYRFGTVNDEAGHGHPLYNRGLSFYGAHVIDNSNWIEELKKIHKVHPRYSEERWSKYKHYLLFFHDEMFEIIAEGFEIEKSNLKLKEASFEIVSRLFP